MKKIHHDIEFTVLRKKLSHTGSVDEKISLLEQLVALNPRNPKNLALRRKYREEMENLRLKRVTKKKVTLSPYNNIHYKRQGVLIGETNTGKSTLFNMLTDADIPVQDTPYTTHHPEVQIMNYNDVPIQVIEVPAIFDGDTDTAKYRFIRNADVLCICAKSRGDCDSVLKQLEGYYIMPVNRESTETNNQTGNEYTEIPAFIAAWDTKISSNLKVLDIRDIASVSERIYSLLNIKRIYSVFKGEIREKPQVFPAEQEVKVYDFIRSIDKRLPAKFRRVKVIHADPAIPDIQAAGLEYILQDGDRVEIHT